MASIKKIDHFVITSACPEQAAAFYQALGFSLKEGDGRCELFAGDFKINLHTKGKELLPHARRVQTGSADFCLEIMGSLKEFVAELTLRGLSFETAIVERHGVRGAMRSAYLRDPDGNLVELSSYTE